MSTVLRSSGGRVWRAALLLTGLTIAAWGQESQFVQLSNGTLTLNGAPFRFGGTNNAALMLSDQATVDQVLGTAQSDHLQVVRTWVFCDGIQCDGGPFYLQYWNAATGAPAYNDTATGLANVDYTIYQAGQLGIKLIVTLTDNWTYYGGMDTYVTWRGLNYHDQFYADPTILQWYENWVGHVLNRVNTITGVAYKDDPAIMAWELANEPRCVGNGLPTSGNCNAQTIVDWIAAASRYIKTVDQNHLVAVGDEGFICPAGNCSDGVDSQSFSSVSSIDLVGFHLYPDTWDWNLAEAAAYIAAHESIAAGLGKPVYMGEFGIESGNGKEAVFNDWANLIFSGGASGAMFWDLAPGTTAASAAETYFSWDEHAGAPALTVMNNFALTMAGSAQQFPPVAGYQWATAPYGEPVTLDVVANDVAYGGATIDPSTINLNPGSQSRQTSLTVDGGVFNVVNGAIQFVPNPGFIGSATGSYTVEDTNQQVSNAGYLFVTVNPVQTDWAVLASFESGTGGWGPRSGAAGTVATSTNFNTDGKHSLQVNVTGGGWFGVTFSTPIDLSPWPSVAMDISSTTAGSSVEFAFQSGSKSAWCQGNAWPETGLFSAMGLSLELQPSVLTCYGSPDLSSVTSLYVYLGTPGTYYLDNLRLGPGANPGAPPPIISGVANAAGSQSGISAGTYVSIYGSNFAPAGSEWMPWSNYVSDGQLPTSLAGVSVSIGGTPAYVEFVSPTQINVLTPNVGTGSTTVTVSTAAGTSAPYGVTSAAVQPAFFQWGSYAVATDTSYNWLVRNGTFSTPTAPAQPGETIILWGTGFGPTTPAAPAGQVTPSGLYSVSGVTVTVGGIQAPVLGTALSPGSAGLYQIAIIVPSGLANGDYPVVAMVGGVSSPSGVKLTVQQ